MKIESMTLKEIADRMGNQASQDEVLEMREILNDSQFVDTDEISDTDWHVFVTKAVKRAKFAKIGTYLHVQEIRSGEEWILPIRARQTLDLKKRIKDWISETFGKSSGVVLDGEPMPHLDGDYYAQIKTDGELPGSAKCWTSGGFFLKSTLN